ncbi:ABC transporter permease [Telmatospirillum siberiense]|uniref:ABC transporter permease n=2 Tax=Telmatospirillum siberiense TaxID=382514 RepID=A0A2N3PV14_9PROT|nr:ABC transporter permease [Telmatospirillum siberiense]
MTGIGIKGYIRFFSDAYNRGVLLDTLLLGVETTVIDILLGFPVAYLYVAAPRWRRFLMFMVLLPLLTSTVVRTFAWVVILGNHGLINTLLAQAGLIGTPLRLLYTPGAVAVAMAQIELPLMILPLITAIGGIDAHIIEASHVLGAGRWRTLRRIVLPLCVPGLLTGTLLVFTGAVSALVTQTLVGGGQLAFMPFYIYQQAIQAQDYPFAACVAIVLLMTILLIVSILNALGRRSAGYVHG